jgi:hypothetical protein
MPQVTSRHKLRPVLQTFLSLWHHLLQTFLDLGLSLVLSLLMRLNNGPKHLSKKNTKITSAAIVPNKDKMTAHCGMSTVGEFGGLGGGSGGGGVGGGCGGSGGGDGGDFLLLMLHSSLLFHLPFARSHLITASAASRADRRVRAYAIR